MNCLLENSATFCRYNLDYGLLHFVCNDGKSKRLPLCHCEILR
ncbi:hypothetical protein [Helicobacter rodentium]|nr:hypothetical protein [Helicobacter rodentium]